MAAIKHIDDLTDFLKGQPRSINEVAKALKINWRTAVSYLNLLKSLDLIYETDKKFFYKDKNNYFWIPVSPDHEKKIKSIYSAITRFANKTPTKTQAYKILWKVDTKLHLGLPIGWYKYGPCCEVIYHGDEKPLMTLTKPELALIKETTENYTAMDNLELQRKIYQEEDNKLYLTKEEILKTKSSESILKLIKYVPKDAIETTTDFARLILLKGWDDEGFKTLWDYIALLNYKETLPEQYRYTIIDAKIEDAKKDAQTLILNLVDKYMESKHSQDSRFQDWKKKRNQKHS